MVNKIFLPLVISIFSLELFAQDKEFTLGELAKHNKANDCWTQINQNVYNITDYLDKHNEFDYDIFKWCGRNSTEAYQTKDGKGKKHSRKAELLLKKYLIGKIK